MPAANVTLNSVDIRETETIQRLLDTQGFCVISGLLPQKEMEDLAASTEKHFKQRKFSRRNGVISHGRHRFIANTMFITNALQLYTNPNLIEIADRYCGSESHLSNHRIYRNLSSFTSKMVWHKDNKSDSFDSKGNLQSQMESSDKGLILILYLSDVKDGGLQFVPGTHESLNEKETFANSEIPAKDVISFNNVPRGTGILYDYRIIHRAQPVRRPGHKRDSLFAQMSPDWMPVGEPIALKASDVGQVSEAGRRFLGMNVRERIQHSPHYPIDFGDKGSLKRVLITLLSR